MRKGGVRVLVQLKFIWKSPVEGKKICYGRISTTGQPRV